VAVVVAGGAAATAAVAAVAAGATSLGLLTRRQPFPAGTCNPSAGVPSAHG
jgi:hypothetical protein